MATILVVDDQRNMRATLGMMLRGSGHEVHEAPSGEKACKSVDSVSFDLVLTDLKMQFKDGLDVLRHVRRNAPLTEVIVMTAYGTVETAVEAMRLGAFDKTVMHRGEARVREEFERLLPVMQSGGFVPSVDHQTPPEVSLEDYRAYLELLWEYSVKGAAGRPPKK